MKEDAIEKNIFDAIERGKVKMRPRWHFVVRTGLAAAAAIVLFLLLVCLGSMAIFTLHESGAWFAYDFGFAGWYLFLRSLPLVLIVLTLIFTAAVVLLARQYAFAYHRPLIYLLIVIVGFATLINFLVVPPAFHRTIADYAGDNLPFISAFYEFEEMVPSTVHRGEIVAFTNSGFVLQNLGGTVTATVVFATTSFRTGDVVVVFGDVNASGTIYPFGAEKIVPW
ncbi:MAG: hypothetical protein ABSC29_02810 [Minisyncoccia bacterium]|jgi:hypothetical protein